MSFGKIPRSQQWRMLAYLTLFHRLFLVDFWRYLDAILQRIWGVRGRDGSNRSENCWIQRQLCLFPPLDGCPGTWTTSLVIRAPQLTCRSSVSSTSSAPSEPTSSFAASSSSSSSHSVRPSSLSHSLSFYALLLTQPLSLPRWSILESRARCDRRCHQTRRCWRRMLFRRLPPWLVDLCRHHARIARLPPPDPCW